MRFSFSGVRVLVTGASGFLGGHLCEALVEAGAEVNAVSRVDRHARSAGIRWWRCALQDFDQAEALVRNTKPEVIFHLGGRVSAAADLRLVRPTFHSLLATTVNLLELAVEHASRRLVLVGSLEEPHGVTAEDAIPSSPYSAAKLAAGAYGRMFHQLYGCSVVNVRPFMTYGPAQADDKVIPATIIALLRREAPRLSSGRRPLDWVYVDDVVEGLLRASMAPGAEGKTIDLGSGTALTVREIVERLTRLIDPSITPQFGVLPDRPGGDVRVASADRAFAVLGWRPTTSLENGLQRTIAWYRARYFERMPEQRSARS